MCWLQQILSQGKPCIGLKILKFEVNGSGPVFSEKSMFRSLYVAAQNEQPWRSSWERAMLVNLCQITSRVAQSVMCLTAGPGVASFILALYHTFLEINHEIISTAIFLLSPDSRRVVVSYKRKYVQEVLVNPLVKLAQEKSVVR